MNSSIEQCMHMKLKCRVINHRCWRYDEGIIENKLSL
jgi:hypothetical protein